MSRFQFILVGVAALCMVGCVFFPPASAEFIGFGSCRDPREPSSLNVTALDVTPYPTEVGGAARFVFYIRNDNTILEGSISLFEINESNILPRFYTFCQAGCPPPSRPLPLYLPALTGQRFIVRILNQERYGDCIYFDTRGGNLTLKPEVIPTANPAAITVTAI